MTCMCTQLQSSSCETHFMLFCMFIQPWKIAYKTHFHGTCMTVYILCLYLLCAGSLLVSGPVFSGGGLPSTLTCVSSNLPATTIEWTLNGNTLSDALTTSVLIDPLTSQYTHTLTLTERQGGEYGCSLSAINDDSMTAVNDTALLNVAGDKIYNS